MVPKGGFEPPDSCSNSNDLQRPPVRRLAYKSIKKRKPKLGGFTLKHGLAESMTVLSPSV